MNKGQLVDAVARRLGDEQAALAAVDAVTDTIIDTVARGETVQLDGLGTFQRKIRPARNVRHAGGTLRIPATPIPRFTPDDVFRARVASRSA